MYHAFMWRWLRRFVVCLVLAVATTVVGAWVCVWAYQPVGTQYAPLEARSAWWYIRVDTTQSRGGELIDFSYTPMPGEWGRERPPIPDRIKRALPRSIDPETQLANDLIRGCYAEFGWPWRALQMTSNYDRANGWLVWQGVVRIPLVGDFVPQRFAGNLPATIVPREFALNTLIFFAFWCAMIGALRWNRSLKRRGHCPECAYDLRGDRSRGCPECGWKREPQAIAADPAGDGHERDQSSG